MTRNLVPLLLVCATVSLSAGAVMAESRRTPIQFDALDTNSDGQITQEEMRARGKARLEEADADGNGLLTAEELASIGRSSALERAERMISRLDSDDDGQLSFAELSERRGFGSRFERADADGDGGLSREEFEDARERLRKRGHRR